MLVQAMILNKIIQLESKNGKNKLLNQLLSMKDKNLNKMNNLNSICLAYFHFFLNHQIIAKFK